ncbi:unnamed protein product [Symbiodinium sp. CCMP2592]|nr:unnamed protein product [Symbiodinium sp. CCMP2592]CAE7422552.1 unnamed protein product [Symbiodinium sp. CCMP2592]
MTLQGFDKNETKGVGKGKTACPIDAKQTLAMFLHEVQKLKTFILAHTEDPQMDMIVAAYHFCSKLESAVNFARETLLRARLPQVNPPTTTGDPTAAGLFEDPLPGHVHCKLISAVSGNLLSTVNLRGGEPYMPQVPFARLCDALHAPGFQLLDQKPHGVDVVFPGPGLAPDPGQVELQLMALSTKNAATMRIYVAQEPCVMNIKVSDSSDVHFQTQTVTRRMFPRSTPMFEMLELAQTFAATAGDRTLRQICAPDAEGTLAKKTLRTLMQLLRTNAGKRKLSEFRTESGDYAIVLLFKGPVAYIRQKAFFDEAYAKIPVSAKNEQVSCGKWLLREILSGGCDP